MFAEEVEGACLGPNTSEDVSPTEDVWTSPYASPHVLSPTTAGPSNSATAETTAMAITPTAAAATTVVHTRKRRNEVLREQSDVLFQLKIKKAKL